MISKKHFARLLPRFIVAMCVAFLVLVFLDVPYQVLVLNEKKIGAARNRTDVLSCVVFLREEKASLKDFPRPFYDALDISARAKLKKLYKYTIFGEYIIISYDDVTSNVLIVLPVYE